MTLDRNYNFNYKPQLTYVTDDINTIDNIGSTSSAFYEQKAESYKNNLASDAIIKIGSNLTKIEYIESAIDDKLKNITVPIQSDMIDDVIIGILADHSDIGKLVNDNIVTYQLYKDCLNNEILGPITTAWEQYHSGIDGMLEAELLPYIILIKEDIVNVQEVIDKTVLYNKTSQDIDSLKAAEIKEIETFTQLSDSIYNAYKSSDFNVDKINIIKKQKDTMESQLDTEKRVISISKDFINEADEIITTIGDLIDNNSKGNVQARAKDDVVKIATQMKADARYTTKMKLMVYQGFKKQKEILTAMKHNLDTMYNQAVKKSTLDKIVTDIRVSLDVAFPMLNDLYYTQFDDEMLDSLAHIINGAEDAITKQQYGMLEMKNILKSTTKNVKGHIQSVSDKNNTRIMYKNL